MTDGVREGLSLLANRYQIGELIGRGGMADVHVGTDARLGRRVAIKLLKPQLASDPAFRTRFRQEAQAAARMAHPTIVRVYDAGEETVRDRSGHDVQVPFIVMEHVQGRLLKDLLHDGPLDPAEAVRITAGVLTALEYSHRAGVVHRDIKPGNVMIADGGQVKVMDFGIARAISDSSATVAQTTAILGTAQYFSPEQARGETVDARSDLYSTGVLLFELLTGRPPFRAESAVAVAYQHVSAVPVAPSTVEPAVTPPLDAVVLRSLAKDRFDRFQTAGDFRTDLLAAAEGRAPARRAPVVDPSATLFGVDPSSRAGSDAVLRELASDDNDRPQRTQTRPPVAWIWVGILLVAVVVVATAFWVLNLQPPSLAGDRVQVPDVVGASYEDGEQTLDEMGLVPTRIEVEDDQVPEGDIVSVDPAVGTEVDETQPVRVTVSSGPATVTVPSVDGLPVDQAWAAVVEAGLAQGEQSSDYSPSIAAGAVLMASPEADSEVAPGTRVDVVVSNGLVQVPNVILQSQEAAVQTLGDELDLDVQVRPDLGCTGGSVSTQSVPPGDAPQGSTVVLTVCSAA